MGTLRVTEKTRKFKRRKRRNKRTTKVRQLGVTEGTQYQSGLGFTATEQEQVEHIPRPSSLPSDNMKYERVVLFGDNIKR